MSLRKTLNNLLATFGLVLDRSTPAVLKSQARLDVDFDFLIRSVISRRGGTFSFVQIGANDGVSRSDDLMNYVKEFDTTALMVEPQPGLFSMLESNYADHSGVVLINKAVHRTKTTMILYRFDPETLRNRADLPLWAKTNGIASFSRRHVLDHAKKLRLDSDIIQEISVECISVDNLMARCDRSPDLLKIDVEGYDYEILDALDLDRFRPALIRFENLHMKSQHYRMIIDKLAAAGYRFLATRMDTTAYLPPAVAGFHLP